jgi:hypothetical protein
MQPFAGLTGRERRTCRDGLSTENGFAGGRFGQMSVKEDPCLNGDIGVWRPAREHDAKLRADYAECVYYSGSAKRKLSHGLRQRCAGYFPHITCSIHTYCGMGPLNNFDIDLILIFYLQYARHKYLAKVIRFESLKICVEFRGRHGELPPFYW